MPATRQNARYWLLTIPENDWSPPADATAFTVDFASLAYLRGQKEIGTNTGFRHWQLLAAYKRPQRLAAVKRTFGPTCHAEMGRSDAAREYVWKEDTRVPDTQFEFGTFSMRRNEETDWNMVRELAMNGNLTEVGSRYPDILVRHYSNLRNISADNAVRPAHLPGSSGVWIYGPPGVGKSHYARQRWPDYYDKGLNKWWTGYKDEPFALLDDVDHENARFLGLLTYYLSNIRLLPQNLGRSVCVCGANPRVKNPHPPEIDHRYIQLYDRSTMAKRPRYGSSVEGTLPSNSHTTSTTQLPFPSTHVGR